MSGEAPSEFLPRRTCPCRCHRDSFAHLPDARGRGSSSDTPLWFVRIGVPLSANLISAGFFFSVPPPNATKAGAAVFLIYIGAVILAVGIVTLGIGLLRSPQTS
jgi:hypothetical protein